MDWITLGPECPGSESCPKVTISSDGKRFRFQGFDVLGLDIPPSERVVELPANVVIQAMQEFKCHENRTFKDIG